MREVVLKRPAVVICLLFCTIVYIIIYAGGGIDLNERIEDDKEINIIGEIYDKGNKNFSEILYVKGARCDGKYSASNYIIYIQHDLISRYKIGQTVEVKGRYQNFQLPENEGQFNARKYYRIRRIDAKIKSAEVMNCSVKYNIYKDLLYKIKETTKRAYQDRLSRKNYGTLCALVLGDKDNLDSEVKEMYQEAGVAHILALSGLHIATLGTLLLSLLRKTGMSIKLSAVLSISVMVSYAILTGLSTSTVRALIMFILSLISKSIGRTYDLLTAVSISSILIVMENPYYILDTGFLMSVSAVLGISILYPALHYVFKIDGLHKCKILETLGNSVLVSLSATLATLPVTVNNYYKVPTYGILVNIIVVPFAGVVLCFGIITGIGANLGLHKIPDICVVPIEVILNYYSKIVEKYGDLSNNTIITGHVNMWKSVVYIILMLAFCILSKGVYTNNNSINNRLSRWVNVRWTRIISKSLGILLMSGALGIVFYREYKALEIRVVSVGQGACNLIWGKNIPTIMIDGGSSDVKDVWKYRIKPVLLYNGIDEIDYVFITHPDEDHVSGIKEMLSEGGCIKVKKVVMSLYDDELCNLSIGYSDDKNSKYDLVKNENNKLCKQYITMNSGESIENDYVRIECISPEYVKGLNWRMVDANEESLVLKLTDKKSGFKALFTGDIGEETEKKLIDSKMLDGVDFLTAAHHGSRYSNSADFLNVLRPVIVTISAGIHNSYGHPHQETLDRLDKFAPDAKVLRTDECGQITIKITGNKISLRRFVDKK